MYEVMVDHWEAFGPPVYMPVASYFGLNKGRKADVPKDTPEVSAGTASQEDVEKYGNLNELAAMFGSGVIN